MTTIRVLEVSSCLIDDAFVTCLITFARSYLDLGFCWCPLQSGGFVNPVPALVARGDVFVSLVGGVCISGGVWQKVGRTLQKQSALCCLSNVYTRNVQYSNI